MFQMDDIKNNYKFKQGEIFKRMKCSTFVQLVLQVSKWLLSVDKALYQHFPRHIGFHNTKLVANIDTFHSL